MKKPTLFILLFLLLSCSLFAQNTNSFGRFSEYYQLSPREAHSILIDQAPFDSSWLHSPVGLSDTLPIHRLPFGYYLSVSARETLSGVEARVEVKPSYGLSDDEITQMLQSGFEYARADMEARGVKEQQVEASRVIEATEKALAADGDLLSPDERAALDAAVASLRSAADGLDARAIKLALEAFNRASNEFASRRMDRSIRAALSGHKIDDIRI